MSKLVYDVYRSKSRRGFLKISRRSSCRGWDKISLFKISSCRGWDKIQFVR